MVQYSDVDKTLRKGYDVRISLRIFQVHGKDIGHMARGMNGTHTGRKVKNMNIEI